MRVLLTGGAGYIGTELVHRLAWNPQVEQVVVYDNLARRNYNLFMEGRLPAGKVEFVEAELLDTRRLGMHLKGMDVVFHLAAVVSTPFSNENPHLFEQVNHWGTAELGYLLEESEVRRVVYASSSSVYGLRDQEAGRGGANAGVVGNEGPGEGEKGVGHEEPDVPRPTSHYGISKLAGERMLTRLADRLEVVVLRCGNVFGYSRSMRFDSVINRFMFYAHHQGRIHIHGDGTQQRPFVSIGRVVEAMERAGGVGEPIGPGIYDLVEWNLSVGEIASHVRELYPDVETLHVSPEMRMGGLRIRPDAVLGAATPERPLARVLQEFHDGFSLGDPARAT